MNSLAALCEPMREETSRPELLLADDDVLARSLVSVRVRETLGAVSILEAADGAEAIQLALQQRPRIALLDVGMPRVDGFVVALTLRGLLPDVHVALHSAESTAHRERALEHRLPLFDKLHVDEAVAWVEAASLTHDRGSQKRAFECGVCGYGVVRATPPASCVMCRSEGTWVHAPWRPFAPRA